MSSVAERCPGVPHQSNLECRLDASPKLSSSGLEASLVCKREAFRSG